MRQITGTLEERHIKAVVLSGTDVLDEVFVAELLLASVTTKVTGFAPRLAQLKVFGVTLVVAIVQLSDEPAEIALISPGVSE